jgi:hypothetical protein
MDIIGIGAVADLAKTAINAIWPDKTEQEKAQLAAAVALVQGQLSVNQAEATNPSIFVSGWRPFVGWVCGSGFGIQFVIGPLAEWGSNIAGHPVKFPPMDLGTMMPLLLGMLGLGGLRTAEKIQGVAAK